MGFFKKRKRQNRATNKTGFTSYDDVYAILKDTIDESPEFYQIEPAKVLEVLLDPDDLPEIEGPEGTGKIPDYYYLGTIKARFLESQGEGDSIPGYIKPLSPHFVSYPEPDEVVNVALHGGQLYYYTPLNIKNRPNLNLMENEKSDAKVKAEATEFNRSLLGEHGDVVINGRFGQGLKFGSDPSYQYPDIKITNRQSVTDHKKVDDYYPHLQNIHADGSSIFISSGPIRKIDQIIPATITSSDRELPDILQGDMITINSDKLVFNSKKDDIWMFANRNLNLSSNNEINLELGIESLGGRITFGDANSTNPMIKGRQLVELIFGLFGALRDFSNTVSTSTGVKQIAEAAMTLKDDLATVKVNKVPPIVSDKVFIGENQYEEIEEVTEVVGEVEQVVVVAGVRG